MPLVLFIVGIPLLLLGLSQLFIAFPTITDLISGFETFSGFVSSFVFWTAIPATVLYVFVILKNRKSIKSGKQG